MGIHITEIQLKLKPYGIAIPKLMDFIVNTFTESVCVWVSEWGREGGSEWVSEWSKLFVCEREYNVQMIMLL